MSEQNSAKDALSRRDFLKLLGAAGVALTFTPFVPWGKFMPNPSNASLERAQVILPDGTQANVKTFPKNHSEVITYPKTGDSVLDQEAFKKWQFIRLPEELGGDKDDVSAFRAYRNHPVRWAGQRVRSGRAAVRSPPVRRGRAGFRDLLRHAVDGPRAGRPDGRLRSARVRSHAA